MYVVDSGSSNGTYVNEEKVVVSIPVKINDGDIVSFAVLHFKVKFVENEENNI